MSKKEIYRFDETGRRAAVEGVAGFTRRKFEGCKLIRLTYGEKSHVTEGE